MIDVKIFDCKRCVRVALRLEPIATLLLVVIVTIISENHLSGPDLADAAEEHTD